jgi:uncharacterized membrane protein
LLFVTLWVSTICNCLAYFQVSCECLHGQWPIVCLFFLLLMTIFETHMHISKKKLRSIIPCYRYTNMIIVFSLIVKGWSQLASYLCMWFLFDFIWICFSYGNES